MDVRDELGELLHLAHALVCRLVCEVASLFGAQSAFPHGVR
jgi:hypothetical protein